MNTNYKNVQTVVIELWDGRKLYFSGPEQVDKSEKAWVKSVSFGAGRPLPDNCEFEEIPKGERNDT